MIGKLWHPKPLVFRRLLFVVILLAGGLQLWLIGAPSARAEEPPQGMLSLTIAPPILPADGRTQPIIYVQLLSPDGVPRLTSHDMEVSLVSSDARIVGVPEQNQILAGESYTVVSLTTTSAAGTASITATSPGLASSTAAVETVDILGAIQPFRLALYAAPEKMLAGVEPRGRLSVVLLGANNRSVPAPESVNVILSSSDSEVVRNAGRITIPKGTHFVTTELEHLSVGSATLTAVSPGFVSEFIEVHVVEPGESAEALVLHMSPPFLRSGHDNHQEVIVQAVDGNGVPVLFPCITEVHLASSLPLSVDVAPVAEVACNQDVQYATSILTIGASPGTAIITAAATELRPVAADITVQVQEPAELKAYLAPLVLLGLEAVPGFVVVQVLDGAGVPINSHDDIPVKIVGGNGTLPDEVVILRGRSFVRMELGGLKIGNEAELWFLNPDLASSQVLLKYDALPTSVEVEASGGPLFPGDKSEILVRVLSAGVPLPKSRLTWTATNGTLSDAALETDGKGEGRAVFTAQEPGDGTVEVVVNVAGYEEAKAQTTVGVVAPVETSKPAAKLAGIPVLYAFLVIAAGVLVYIVYRLFPLVIRRPVT